MKSYLLILIRIGMINFILILSVMVYLSWRPVVASTTKKPIAANFSPSPTELVDLTEPTVSPTPTDVPYVIETTTPEPTATPKPSSTKSPTPRPSNTSQPSSAATNQPTQQPTAQPTQQSTQQPTQQPTAQPTQTPTPTQPPNPLLVKVAPHNTESNCWMVIDSHIYNVTDYMRLHPGGKDPLVKYCGKDGTTGYHTKDLTPPTDHTPTSNSMLELFLVE